MNRNNLKNIVTLRDVTEDDLPVLFEQQQDPEANQLAAVPARDRDNFQAHWQKILSDVTVISKAVIFDGQLVGQVLSWQQDGQRKIGYWLGRKYWGQGIATQAVAQFLTLDTERPLTAYVAKHNSASLRILQKQGFMIVGEDKGPFGPEDEEVPLFILKLNEDLDAVQ